MHRELARQSEGLHPAVQPSAADHTIPTASGHTHVLLCSHRPGLEARQSPRRIDRGAGRKDARVQAAHDFHVLLHGALLHRVLGAHANHHTVQILRRNDCDQEVLQLAVLRLSLAGRLQVFHKSVHLRV